MPTSLDLGPRGSPLSMHFEATGPGEQWAWRNLQIDEREHYGLGTLELRSVAVAVGRVVDPMGQPIEGASIVYTQVDPVDPFGDPQTYSAGQSDSDGRFITRTPTSLNANWVVEDEGLQSAPKQGEVVLGERLEDEPSAPFAADAKGASSRRRPRRGWGRSPLPSR